MTVTVTCLDTAHVEEIRQDVAEILETDGVIQASKPDRFTAETQEALMEALDNPALWICDFCSSPDVEWSYPASDYTMMRSDGMEHISRSAWAACGICAHLIEMELWDDLNKRARDRFPYSPSPLAEALVMEAIKGNTVRFRQHRTGPPERIGGDEGEEEAEESDEGTGQGVSAEDVEGDAG